MKSVSVSKAKKMYTYMMRLTPRHLRQPLLTPQPPIKSLTLHLRTRILPIRTKRMAKRTLSPVPLKLLQQRLPRI
jgi:hypothetical protein